MSFDFDPVYLIYALVAASGSVAAAVIVALALGAINLLCVLAPVSQSRFYQGVLGWLNWLMPMSWLVVALGSLFYLVSFLLHAVTGGKVAYLRIEDFGADWKTGTFFIKGGLISNLNYLDTAFNMGNFSFVDYKSGAWHKDHEAGHTLAQIQRIRLGHRESPPPESESRTMPYGNPSRFKLRVRRSSLFVTEKPPLTRT